jgi:hypothetical protein
MLKLFRVVRNTLITVALVGGPLAGCASMTEDAHTRETRAQLEKAAELIGVSRDKIQYAGIDGKPMSSAAFYMALQADPKHGHEGTATVSFPKNPDKPDSFTVKLSPKEQ